MIIVTMKDWRKCGGCPDARLWCEEYGIDWRSFVWNGIDVELLKATGDNLSRIADLEFAAIERERNGK